MSGLNDDIEGDIEQELSGSDKLQVTPKQFTEIDSTDIKTGKDQPEAPKIILKVGEDQVDEDGRSITPTVSELFGKEVVPNQLPDLNAKIVLVENTGNSVTDARSTLNGITLRNAISQEDINEINSIFPGYLNDSEKIEYYTKTPTLTRYTTAVNTIGFKIADQQKEQLSLTVETFTLLKDSIAKTQAYLKDNLIDTMQVKQKKIVFLMTIIEDSNKDKDISGYHAIINKLLSSDLEENNLKPTKGFAGLIQKAVNNVDKPTAFASLLNKMIFLKEEMDQYFVFDSLSSHDNMTERTVHATVKELIEQVYSKEKLTLLSLLDDILAAGVNYVNESILAIKDNDATDISKEPDPLNVLKRESQAVVSVNILINQMIEFDGIMYEIAEEAVKIIKSIP